MANWMLYGAYGYTGQLLAEEAVRRGHKPILAGRSAEKLRPLAQRLNLESVAVDLVNEPALAKAVAAVDLVLHAAGPFSETSGPMVRACIVGKTHYLDITGEISVLENTFAYDQSALEQHIALIPGVGFDVVPTDCMAKYVADHIPNATELEIAFDAISAVSAGTAKSALAMGPDGFWARRDGRLMPGLPGEIRKKIRFSHRERNAVSIPWGDLSTAYRSTGIPNITTYTTLGVPLVKVAARSLSLVNPILVRKTVRHLANSLIDQIFKGPTAKKRQEGRSYIWARAANGSGTEYQAWLETLEPYQLTAVTGIRAVEKVLASNLTGAKTPAQAFGVDFVLEVEGTKRFDKLTSTLS